MEVMAKIGLRLNNMMKDELAGFVMNLETAQVYFERVMEAEKKMGPLSREERIIILKSIASPLTLEELMDTIAGKRVLVVKDKNEKS
jgi:hypothetical protein